MRTEKQRRKREKQRRFALIKIMANDDNGESDVDGKVEEERGEVQRAAEDKQAEVTVDVL